MRDKAILLSSMRNIFYFTGFTGSLGYGLILNDKKYLFVDFRYFNQAKEETAGKDIKVILIPKDDLSLLKELLIYSKIEKLYIEDYFLTVFKFNYLKEILVDIILLPIGGFLEKKRMIKNQTEINSIEKGAQILDLIYLEVLENISSFKTEKDVANFIEFQMKKNGSSGPSFETIVAFGKNSSYPHWKASNSLIGEEGFLKMDFGCYFNNYGSDLTRTIYIGENPSKKHLEIYEIVKEAQKLAISKIREGITSKELDKVARDYIEKKGYGEYFQHGLGHGLGIPGGEMPYLSNTTEEIVLKKNMVITIEPGIYVPGLGGVRIEDDVLVQESGCKVLTKCSRELKIIKR
ncbi:aminopeptidase P family protein [Cetobacterium sp.]|uniref:aminopeptidase P family protein n=1 Tax=Cetobacterium sp. TaxID=2071632 RepID=UPI003EE72C64